MSLGLKIRKFIYTALFNIDTLLNRKARTIVLCYHSISNNSHWRHSITKEMFISQLDYLRKHFDFISPNDLFNNERRGALITLDDGYKDNLELKELFSEYGITPILFVIKDINNVKRGEIDNDIQFLSELDIETLKNAGWTIGSHTQTHPNLTSLNAEELGREVSNPEELKYFSYPKGNYNDITIAAIKTAGYDMAFTMDDGFVNSKTDAYKIPRIGVDASHDLNDFKASISPSVIAFRRVVKSLFPKYLIERTIQ